MSYYKTKHHKTHKKRKNAPPKQKGGRGGTSTHPGPGAIPNPENVFESLPDVATPPFCVGFYSAKPKLAMIALLGPLAPTVSGGYGGWSEVQRPRRPAMTKYDGRAPFKLDIDIMIDGYMFDQPVERAIEQLDKLAIHDERRDDEPPRVKVFGPLRPRFLNMEWVILDIEWASESPDVITNQGGDHLRQRAMVHLSEYVPDDRIKLDLGGRKGAAARKKKAKKAGQRSATVRHGESLQEFAKRTMGDRSKWKEIAKLNHIRDPKRIHAGQKLKLP